jgi:ribA/ribD-fused uncharacterized protein
MTDTGAILHFRDEYHFLSNYAYTPMRWQGIDFHSGEQAFAWAKTKFANSRIAQPYAHDILNCDSPGEAKRLGRKVPINVKEWDSHKVMQMRELVHAKFLTGRMEDDSLVGRLCNTGVKMLIEGNDWGDKFWGRVYENNKWTGLNVLGVILMEERGWWSRGTEGRPTSSAVQSHLSSL